MSEAAPSTAELAELMRALEEPTLFARVAPGLEVGDAIAPGASPETWSEGDLARASRLLATEGWLELPRAASDEEVRSLLGAIDALGERGLPPLFVYVFDLGWKIGARVAEALSRAVGVRYDLLADAWAFRIPAGPGHAGWPPHRGSYTLSRDRRAPDIVNVWVAITDATLDNSCMVVVPLDADDAYPEDLRSHEAHRAHGRPLPVPAGTALAWNANVLHWGGPSTPQATGPRVSITFSLRRVAQEANEGTAALDLARFDRRDRLDLIADQVLVYGDSDPTLPDVVRRWAEVTVGLRKAALFARGEDARKAP